MYNPVPIFLTDPAWRSRIFPTVPMLSVTGRLRGCAWSGGSPWGSPPGQDRRSFSRFQSLSYRQTFPVAVFSWQKLAPGVVFPYGSWLCWKKLRSGSCRETRWVRSVRQFLHRKESYRRKGGEGADRLGMESSRCWAAEHERISFRGVVRGSAFRAGGEGCAGRFPAGRGRPCCFSTRRRIRERPRRLSGVVPGKCRRAWMRRRFLASARLPRDLLLPPLIPPGA